MSNDKQNKPTPSNESHPTNVPERPFRESTHEIAYNNGERSSDTLQSVMPPPKDPGKKK